MAALAPTPVSPPLHSAVDLERWPIHEPTSESYRAAVSRVRRDLADGGCSIIREFFRPDAVSSIRAEASGLIPHAHVNDIRTNPYSTRDDPSLPEDHPVRLFMDRSNAFVPKDHIPEDCALRRLYADPCFQTFVADCLEEDEIHEYADPLAGLVINLLGPGCQHPWHYDANEFIVSTLVQAAEEGGVFEYCPDIRSPGDENIAAVSDVILGRDRSRVRRLSLRAGDLQLFKGRFALHRVTRVGGSRPRLTGIFAYAKQPGFVSTIERATQLFGRATEVHHRVHGRRPAHDGLID